MQGTAFFLLACVWLVVRSDVACAQFSGSYLPLPAGIDIRMTMVGPVFVDEHGMTLYQMGHRSAEEALYPRTCNYQRRSIVLLRDLGDLGLGITARDGQSRRSCAEKRPPLLVRPPLSAGSRWNIVPRDDGAQQLAYDGDPLYRSSKDRTPGDVNGVIPAITPEEDTYYPWRVARAPLPGVPPGITATTIATGIALATSNGKTLYFRDEDPAPVNAAQWQPFAGPVLADSERLPGWSLMTGAGDARQWMYHRHSLYTYARDAHFSGVRAFGDIFGDMYGRTPTGWHVALLESAPAHPPEVTVQPQVANDEGINSLNVYADGHGRTLYTFYCVENTADLLDCDDVRDDPRYWLQFCGGTEACAKTWHPSLAPSRATPIGHVWSPVWMNTQSPWQPVCSDCAAVRVWAYRGRPVFTYERDFRPGDYNGRTLASGQEIRAQPILAYDASASIVDK